jgi:hypothetical protein
MNWPVAGGGISDPAVLVDAMGISRINRRSAPAIFTCIPGRSIRRSRLPAGLLSRFRHYRNLDKPKDGCVNSFATSDSPVG